MPIVQAHVMLGFTYSQVFKSYMHGYLFMVPVVYIGVMIGSMGALMLSRYLFRDFVSK